MQADRDGAAYGDDFFNTQADESRTAAAVVVPLVLEMFSIASVLDVGCGIGAWAEAFAREGVEDVAGVDGDWVRPEQLLISVDRFTARDLSQPLDLGRRYDLAVSLEVAEHLPPESADTLIASLVRHSDLILFSAAVPGQGGTNHVNEQWPSYWVHRFGLAGFTLHDVVRPRIWTDSRVGYWYRQNILVFASAAGLTDGVSALAPASAPIDVVHPYLLMQRNEELDAVPPIRTSLRHIVAGVQRKLGRSRDRTEGSAR